MNVTLTPALEEFVRGKVESGAFRSAEEVVKEGVAFVATARGTISSRRQFQN
jgi:putative addiction module CopG family antidote